MMPIEAEQHFPWYIDVADTDNIDCQCGQPCPGIAGWATHITENIKGDRINDTLTPISYAVQQFISTWAGEHLARDIADKLTCEEANTLANLLNALGQLSAAKQWISAHAASDDCGDQHCPCQDCTQGAII